MMFLVIAGMGVGFLGGMFFERGRRRRLIVRALEADEFERMRGLADEDCYWDAPLHVAECQVMLAVERLSTSSRGAEALRAEEGFMQGLEAFKFDWMELRRRLRGPVEGARARGAEAGGVDGDEDDD